MILEYSAQKTFTQALAVADAGNMALKCSTDGGGIEYYVITRTIMGKTTILTSGPSLADAPNVFLEKYNFGTVRINYNEKQLEKLLKAYINDVNKKISQIDEITTTEALPNLVEAYNNL